MFRIIAGENQYLFEANNNFKNGYLSQKGKEIGIGATHHPAVWIVIVVWYIWIRVNGDIGRRQNSRMNCRAFAILFMWVFNDVDFQWKLRLN